MRRAEAMVLALVLAAGLGGCASSSRPLPEPRLRVQAQDAEASGARRHAQGDYAAAGRHFAEALRLRLSLDDGPGAARNRLQLAQTLLALDQVELGLAQAALVQDTGLRAQALLLQVQGRLSQGQLPAAQGLLAELETVCGASCPERGRVLLLQARVAWAGGQPGPTIQQASAALPRLRERGEEREVANAWRLLAAAQLQSGDTTAALAAAEAALALDRQLALPEKIAHDWLLIGDIHRRADLVGARAAYQRAQAVAQAAQLSQLAELAGARIKETSP